MSNEFKESIKVELKRAESPEEILEGIEKKPQALGTCKGSRLVEMPELMISKEEHQEIENKTITRVLEKLGKEPEI